MSLKKLRLVLPILFLLEISSQNQVLAQQAYRIKLLSSFNDSNLPKVDGTDIWNDVYGYFDPVKKREYVICGGTDSIYFMDITNPDKMIMVDREPGASFFCRNRDFETYSHYAYCVSDQGSGVGALQIFDLNYLPDSVHKVYQSNAFCSFSHTLHIDTASKRLYLCSVIRPGGFSAMTVLTLEDPENPKLLFHLKVPTKTGGIPIFNKVHEMYARNDTAYLSCEEAGLFIFDLRDTTNHILIGSITTYPDQGFNHSPWLDKSGRYVMFTDENAGLDVKIFDISNLGSPQFVSQFNSNASAMPHNAYWYGDFAYVSAYHDGLVVYDLTNPANPKKAAWFDTHPDSPEIYGGYKGCWGVYPWLPSKRILASDLTSGIFLFEIDSALIGMEEKFPETEFTLFPNPATDQVKLQLTDYCEGTLIVYDLQGLEVLSEPIRGTAHTIDVARLETGIYVVEISGKTSRLQKKFVKW